MDQRVKQYGVVSPEMLKSSDGLSFLKGMIAGDHPNPPFSEALGFHLTEIEPGRAGVRGPAGIPPLQSDRHRARRLCHDAARFSARLRDLLDARPRATPGPRSNSSSIWCAPMSKDTGPVRAEGRIIHRGRTVATSEGDLKDGAGKLYAHATTTCMIFPAKADAASGCRPPARSAKRAARAPCDARRAGARDGA